MCLTDRRLLLPSMRVHLQSHWMLPMMQKYLHMVALLIELATTEGLPQQTIRSVASIRTFIMYSLIFRAPEPAYPLTIIHGSHFSSRVVCPLGHQRPNLLRALTVINLVPNTSSVKIIKSLLEANWLSLFQKVPHLPPITFIPQINTFQYKFVYISSHLVIYSSS